MRDFGAGYDLGHHSIQETKRNTVVFVFKAPMPLLHAQNGIFAKFTVGARARVHREASARADERAAVLSNFTFREIPRKWPLGMQFLAAIFGGLLFNANFWHSSPTHSRARHPKMKEIIAEVHRNGMFHTADRWDFDFGGSNFGASLLPLPHVPLGQQNCQKQANSPKYSAFTPGPVHLMCRSAHRIGVNLTVDMYS